MKRNRLKEAVALAVCACTLGGAAANAQLVIGSSPASPQSYTVGSSQELSSMDIYNGAFIVNRFGVRDGRLVAYGRLIPSDVSSSVSLSASSSSGLSGSASLGSSSSIGSSSSGTYLRWGGYSSGSTSFDESRLGSWTGIGTGYGESGVESRSNMLSDDDGPVSMNLARPSSEGYWENGLWISADRVSGGVDLQMGPTSGNDRVGMGIDASFGPTSANDRTRLDGNMGATSANDRTVIDAEFGTSSANDRTLLDGDMGASSANDRTILDGDMGATSANDRTRIDASLGATSGNDRTAGGPVDLSFGPTSGNDRTSIDASFGATSANDRTRLDGSMGATSANDRTILDGNMGTTSANDRTLLDGDMGATSANDRTVLDGSMGATSGNDRVGIGVDASFGPTSANDRTAVGLSVSESAPLVQLGGSQTLYSAEEAERALSVMGSASDVAVPVSVVSASCDAVSLSFGGSQPIVVTASSSDAELNSTLCRIAESGYTTSTGNPELLKHLNRLVDHTR